jgi:membrane dipeptidase
LHQNAKPSQRFSTSASLLAAPSKIAQSFSMKHLIFDGHNDVLTKLAKAADPTATAAFLTGLPGQLDLPKARLGGFGGGFFAMWTPSNMPLDDMDDLTTTVPYDVPLPPEVPQSEAWNIIHQQALILLELQTLGALKICTSVAEIDAARAAGQLAAILHLEGAEAIGPDLVELDRLYGMGLRSLGPVWSRRNIFGEGVPFRYPSDGDIGKGLTQAGSDLVQRCGELRILVDLSHLNVAGFWDVAHMSDVPLVATHSNAHTVTPHARNLTDAQLRAIAKSGGVVGVNFESTFVRPDGLPNADIPTAMVLAHMDHLLNILGEQGVAIGSDYDGCMPPKWLNRADKLPALVQAMEQHGYSDTLIDRICWTNWTRVLKDIWGG